MTAMRLGIAIVTASFIAAAASSAPGFQFDPPPRWSEEQETETVCAAIRTECPGLIKDDSIETEWGYAELYDADGMLVGLRSTKSTGCKPLDEHMLLGQRKFRTAFTQPGKPDLDEDIKAELAPGTSKDGVRLVKSGTTQLSMGC